RHHGAVVDLRELAGERRRFDLDDVGPGMRDRDFHGAVRADRHRAFLHHLAVAPHGDFGAADLAALVLDAEADALRLADDAETRRHREHDAAVDLAGMP